MGKIRRFFKTALVFLAGNMLSKLISFFLLPMYTSLIAPDQYGAYDLVMSFINLVAPIAFLQIWDGMFRFAFDYKSDENKQAVVGNAWWVMFGGILVYILMFCGLNFFYRFDYFGYVLVYGFVYALHYVYTFAARVFLKNKLFVFSGVANTLCTALLNLLLIVGFGWDIKAIYVAATVGSVLQMVIIEWKVGVLRHFQFARLDKKLIVAMIKFSAPLCVATISYWLLSGFTKVIITENLGAADNGLYAVANRFAAMITLVVSVIQFAWNETAYLMADDQNRSSGYRICVDLMMKAVCFGTAILCLAIKVIFPWFVDEQYSQALWLIPCTLIGVGANSLAAFYGTLFMTEKKTNFILISTLIAAGVNVLLAGVATRYFGLMGAVAALAVSFVLLMLLRLGKLCKVYEITIKAKYVLLELAAIVSAVIAFYFVDSVVALIGIGIVLGIALLLSVKDWLGVLLRKMTPDRQEQIPVCEVDANENCQDLDEEVRFRRSTMNVTQRVLFDIIKRGLLDEKEPLADQPDWKTILSISKTAHIVPLVYSGIHPEQQMDEDVKKVFRQITYQSMVVDRSQSAAMFKLESIFNENGIDYMPLKGAVIKNLYPRTEVRSMGDLDVLIRLDQYEKIRQLLLSNGFEEGIETDHELIWYKKPYTQFELHKHLIPSYNDDYYAYFGDGWKLAEKTQTPGRYEMSAEHTLIYIFTHFAKHYRDGGIGIRHLVDLWVYRRAYPQLDWQFICDELDKLGLKTFYLNVQKTLDACFEGGEETQITTCIVDSVFRSKVYGSEKKSNEANALRLTKRSRSVHHARLKSAWLQVFPVSAIMRKKYPVLKRVPVLLPVMWVVRWITAVFRKRENISFQHKRLKAINQETVSKYQAELNLVGLDYNF